MIDRLVDLDVVIAILTRQREHYQRKAGARPIDEPETETRADLYRFGAEVVAYMQGLIEEAVIRESEK